MKTKTINIAKDFNRYPLGRLREHSKTSGQEFREDFLVPTFREFDKIIIELDGTEGYGSSFLDEAFANLVRKEGFGKEEVLGKFDFVSKEDPSLISEIISYIKEA